MIVPERENIPGQIIDLLSRSDRPMWSTSGIGRNIYGWDFDSQHDYYRFLLRTLNKMLDQGVLFCCGTVNGGDVWMLAARDLRKSHPDMAASDLDGEIPF